MAENKMYCKLPIPIQAYQTDKEFDIETLEGTMHASVGDYIITGINGEQYPCKPDIFEKTYIPVDPKNKMEQVAAMFGKKLLDKFHVKLGYDTVSARFSPYGFEWFDEHCIWNKNGELLNKLLKGEAVVVDD